MPFAVCKGKIISKQILGILRISEKKQLNFSFHQNFSDESRFFFLNELLFKLKIDRNITSRFKNLYIEVNIATQVILI